MTQPIRLTLVGAGRMGRFHAEALRNASDVEVVSVVDTNTAVASEVASSMGVAATPVDRLTEIDCDGWLIAAATPAHPGLVKQGLDCGKHVLCEKPLSLTPGDGLRLDALAREKGLVLQVGFWRRFSPPWRVAKRLLDSGAIGNPILIRLAQWDADPPPPEFCDPVVSGGLAIDCGVHEYDLAEWLTGNSISRVTTHPLARVDPDLAARGDVDNLLAVMDLGGTTATVDLSRNARFGDDVRTEILGSEGAIFIETLPSGLTRLATSAGIEIVPGSETDDAMADGVVAQAEAFAAVIRGKNLAVPGAGASDRAVAVGLAVQRSAATGTTVAV